MTSMRATMNGLVIDCADPPDGQLRLAFQQVPEGKTVKNRLHLDIEVDDIDAERARLTAEGAVVVADMHTATHGRFQVMLDLEGNEFCLV